MKPIKLTPKECRKILLHSHGLISPLPQKTPVSKIIKSLGYVQIDTIYVVERAHHHILWSRKSNYQVNELKVAQTHNKSVFEYWTHALSYISTDDYRFYIHFMKDYKNKNTAWFGKLDKTLLNKTLQRIQNDGPLAMQDIQEQKISKNHLWASRKPSKSALEFLFFRGDLSISDRDGMRKQYELTNRHFGWKSLPIEPKYSEVVQFIVERALRYQGLLDTKSICFQNNSFRSDVEEHLESLYKNKKIVTVEIESGKSMFVRSDTIENILKIKVPHDQVHILSPFDPLIIQRDRAKTFFNFDYTLECYLPSKKRKFGYFVLPILVGDQFVGRIDLKADRQNKRLIVQSWHWENKSKSRENKKLIEDKLHEYEKFCCQQ